LKLKVKYHFKDKKSRGEFFAYILGVLGYRLIILVLRMKKLIIISC
jgi:hypothetical protein